MIKRFIMAVATVFIMVSISSADFECIQFTGHSPIDVVLEFNHENVYADWAVSIYGFTVAEDSEILVGDAMWLFSAWSNPGEIIDPISITWDENTGIVTNLNMHGNSIHINDGRFGVSVSLMGEQDFYFWNSHTSLNDDNIDHIEINYYNFWGGLEDTYANWIDEDTYCMGRIIFSNTVPSCVPLPGAIWLLGSSLAFLVIRKRR